MPTRLKEAGGHTQCQDHTAWGAGSGPSRPPGSSRAGQAGQGRVPEANSVWSQENEGPHPLRRTLPGGLAHTCLCWWPVLGRRIVPTLPWFPMALGKNRSCNGHGPPHCSSNVPSMVLPLGPLPAPLFPRMFSRLPLSPPGLCSDVAFSLMPPLTTLLNCNPATHS